MIFTFPDCVYVEFVKMLMMTGYQSAAEHYCHQAHEKGDNFYQDIRSHGESKISWTQNCACKIDCFISVPNQSSNTVNVECVTASEVFNMCYLVINYHELIYIKEIKWLYLCFIAVINYGYKFGCVWFKSWVCHT